MIAASASSDLTPANRRASALSLQPSPLTNECVDDISTVPALVQAPPIVDSFLPTEVDVTGNASILSEHSVEVHSANTSSMAGFSTTQSTQRVTVDLSDPALTARPSAPTHPAKKGYAEALRGGSRQPTAFRLKTILTQPSPDQLQRLLDLGADDTDNDDELLQAIAAATPSKPKVATTTIWIETGDSLKEYSNEKIINAVFQENQDAEWADLLLEFVQMNKARSGDVVVSVTSKAVRERLAGKFVSIFGKSFPFAVGHDGASRLKQNPMDVFFFMDIVDIRFNFDSTKLFRLLRRLKTKPIFQSYRQQVAGIACRSNVWRVYFMGETISDKLIVNGHPIDQLKLDGHKYNVFTKHFKRSTARAGFHSPHCLDFDDLDTRFNPQPPHQTAAPPSGESIPKRPRVANSSPTSLPRKTHGDMEGDMEVDNQTALPPSTTRVPTVEAQDFVLATRTKRKSPSDDTRVESWASYNFFDNLRDIQASVKFIDHQGGSRTRFYIPVVDSVPSQFPTTSYIRQQRVESNRLQWHPDNLTLQELVEILQVSADEANEEFHIPSPAQGDTISGLQLDVLTYITQFKADKLWNLAATKARTWNEVLTTLSVQHPGEFRRLVQVHTWHRWVASTKLPVQDTFQSGFHSIFHESPNWAAVNRLQASSNFRLPSTGHPIATTSDIEEALSAFELWLSAQAPSILFSDEWILYLTQQPVTWLPTLRGARMLTTDALWTLLRTPFGQKFTTELVQFCPPPLSTTLQDLSMEMEEHYPSKSVLAFVDGEEPRLHFKPTLQC
ncbi:hypothetical protein DYB32_008797 [Aphanomyces invadans]|uniref:Uncharacterized protein n=1 Tax=Aphanomyces invadans TaxID=157072 RepID=A0A3R6WG82_9STRA|nr:hypothetical protein DYB32_008797 [Aphanomyces invadans]